jgi:acetyl-CoA acetyltransferase
MTTALIAGVGMTEFGHAPGRTPRSLLAEAVNEAIADADLGATPIDLVVVANAFAGTLQGQESVRGQVWLQGGQLGGIPLFNIDNACAGGGSALAVARMAVVSGQARVVVAAGVEKLSHEDRRRPLEAMERALDQERLPELRQSLGLPEQGGSPFMEVYARFAEQYMAETGATANDFAIVAAKNHANGARNPKAQRRVSITVEQVLAARSIAGPLTRPMCAPIGDGAAAVVVAAEDAFPAKKTVRIRATAVGAGGVGERGRLVASTAQRAYEEAGLGPQDVDVIELHDAASPAELIVLDELGITRPGGAIGLVRDGATALTGRLPVNPSGGLISRGHPLGATGLAQIVELTQQLLGRAGSRQVPGARVALAENAGGYLGPDAAAAVVTVLAT